MKIDICVVLQLQNWENRLGELWDSNVDDDRQPE